MDQALFAMPILSSKTESARAYLRELLDGSRKQHLAACGQSVGIVKETWMIQQGPQGDLSVAYMAGDNVAWAFAQLAASQDELDTWQKQQIRETTGVDLDTPLGP